jgi:cell division protein FtsB
LRKKGYNPRPLTQFVAIIALTISIFLIVDFGRRAAANYRSQREAERLTQEVEAARRYQDKLLARRTYAASDLYVEEVARNELKWAKPGEAVFVVLPTFEPARSAGVAPPRQTQALTATAVLPQEAWRRLFFGRQQPIHFAVTPP